MAKKPKKTGKGLERRVAQAYREMGAWKVEHNVTLGGNQIDVYVELVTPARLLHRVAVESKDWASPVGKGIVNDFARIVKLLRDERLVDGGVIVSAVGFTVEAREAAKTYGIQPVEMADLDAMVEEARKRGAVKPATPPIPMLPVPYFAHPYPMQENFTGRVRERQMLTEWLTKDDRPVLALVAMGGMGKSALTWAWVQRDVLGLPLPGQPEDKCETKDACRVAKGQRPDGILWWSFYEREARFAKFVDEAIIYASAGELDPARIPSAHDGVKALVSLLQHKRLLIVLDGFERELRAYASLNAAYQGDEFARDERGDFRSCTDPHAASFLQWIASGALKSRVLITSRLFARELDGLAGCKHEELTAFDPDDAVIFFHAQGVKGTRAEIQDACAPYGYLPLALRLLSGLIVRDKRTPGDIKVASRYPVLPDLKGKEHHHILQVAYEALDEAKRELLSRISAFRSPMTYDAISILNPYESEKEFDGALDELIDRGLLLFDKERNLYDMHPIVRQYAYDRLADKKGVHSRLCDYFSAVPAPDADKIQSLEDLNPVIGLYHHTVRAGRYDDACGLFHDRLRDLLYYRFGAYQTCIQLLRALFPDGEDRPPRLKAKPDQAWILGALAVSYSLSGQSRRAVALFQMDRAIREETKDMGNVAVVLANQAHDELKLGSIRPAGDKLRRRIELCRDIGYEFREAVGHQELGGLLGYGGAFAEAARELEASTAYWRKTGHHQGLCVDETYRTLLALMLENPDAALQSARKAQEHWRMDETQTGLPVERDLTRAEWVHGWALVALAERRAGPNHELLCEAEGHLTQALSRCRKINLVEVEPDILLAWGRWHRAKGNPKEARENAEEALKIADRCEYRLKQAEIHNFMARLALDEGNRKEARKHAEIAYERAWCDGPPHCYKPALDEAEQMLRDLGAEPPKIV